MYGAPRVDLHLPDAEAARGVKLVAELRQRDERVVQEPVVHRRRLARRRLARRRQACAAELRRNPLRFPNEFWGLLRQEDAFEKYET